MSRQSLPENLEHEEGTLPVHSLPLFNSPIKTSLLKSVLANPRGQVLPITVEAHKSPAGFITVK